MQLHIKACASRVRKFKHIPKEHILKTTQLSRLAAVLVLSALALAACNKGATNSNNSNNANNSNNSNSTSNSNSAANQNAATATMTGTGDYSTPSAALKTFYNATKGGDVETVKRSFSKKSLDFLEKGAAKDKKTVDDTIKEMVKDATTPSSLELRNEKIDGDKATVEAKDDKTDKWDTVPLIKESGQWKIAMFDEMGEAMDKLDTGKK